MEAKQSSRNQTIQFDDGEKTEFEPALLKADSLQAGRLDNQILHGDTLDILPLLPDQFVDLLIADPPYNLNKVYAKTAFKQRHDEAYQEWLESWLCGIPRILKPQASLYICGDWSCSSAIYHIASKYFRVINRITWEREKGRGAVKNWKNCSEDIWYLSNGDQPKFNLDAVKLKRKVVAPYTANGVPKDWERTPNGNFRSTFPSNLWTDITVPFWSMPENTRHPTQKPEKLMAKLILASSDQGDMVFDPFLGSGTTAVVAKKLGRRFFGIEQEKEYCLLALKRLHLATTNRRIQGYAEGVFWERNTIPLPLSHS